MEKKRIVFMGTPEFAAHILKYLVENSIDVAAVITMPDKPAGRGQKMQQSAVKTCAQSYNLPVLQPEKLKDEAFLTNLRTINADLFVVVAFRMLPEVVWSMPPMGTINLHASLLPQYRGAAPINWAIINGENETGVTTFFIEKEIDTGKIIEKERITILPDWNAGDLHDCLMELGAKLTLKSVNAIYKGIIEAKEQPKNQSPLHVAPKLFKENCKINWNDSATHIHNKVRGLSPYPAAWTQLHLPNGETKMLKLFQTEISTFLCSEKPGTVRIEKYNCFVATSTHWIQVKELQLEGKKRMDTKTFLLGAALENSFLQ